MWCGSYASTDFSLIIWLFIWNSTMTSFNDYINTIVIKHLIYFYSHMRITEQIINIIPKWFHAFIKDHGAYKHNNTCIVSLHIFRKKILEKIIYRLWFLLIVFRWYCFQLTLMTLTKDSYWYILWFCEHFTCWSC